MLRVLGDRQPDHLGRLLRRAGARARHRGAAAALARAARRRAPAADGARHRPSPASAPTRPSIQTTATRRGRGLRPARAEDLDLERRPRPSTTSSSPRSSPGTRSRGITAFVVEKDDPGLTFGEPMRKMGQRAIVNAEMFLEDVEIARRPAARRRGPGLLRSDAHVRPRRASPSPRPRRGSPAPRSSTPSSTRRRASSSASRSAEHQAVAFRLADMAIRVDAARLLTRRAARLARRRASTSRREAAMAKLLRVRDGDVVHLGRGADARRLGLLARVPRREVDARREARGDRGGHLGHPAADHLAQPAARLSHDRRASFGVRLQPHPKPTWVSPCSRLSAIRSPTSTAGTFVLARGTTGISEQSATTTPLEPAHPTGAVADGERIRLGAHRARADRVVVVGVDPLDRARRGSPRSRRRSASAAAPSQRARAPARFPPPAPPGRGRPDRRDSRGRSPAPRPDRRETTRSRPRDRGSIAATTSITRPASRLCGCAAIGKRWRSYGPVARLERSFPSVCSSGREPRGRRLGQQPAEPLGAGELELDERVVVQVAADARELERRRRSPPRAARPGRRRPSAAGSRASRRRRRRERPSRRRCAPPRRRAGRPPRDHSRTGRSGRRAHGRGSSGSARPRAGSRYANAAFTLTPPATLTGSIPKPTPPSRSSRSSARGRPSAAAASRHARWNGPTSSSPYVRTSSRSSARASAGRIASAPQRPSPVSRGPGVVVGRAADGDDAAVVGRAAADHPGARKRDRLAPGDRRRSRSPSRAR